MIIIGTFGSLASGATFPVMMILFTNIIDSFTGYGSALLCSNKNLTNTTLDFNSTNFTSTNFTSTNITILPFKLSDDMREQALYLTCITICDTV